MKAIRIAAAASAIGALALLGATAHAQTKATEKAAPAKTETKIKGKSACNAITEEVACKADATCTWVAALMDAKTNKQKRKAYCKTKPKPPAKKAKEPAKK